MFVQNFIKLSAAVHEFLCKPRNREKRKTLVITILPSLPWAVIKIMLKVIIYNNCKHYNPH